MKNTIYLLFIVLVLGKTASAQTVVITPGNNQASITASSTNAGVLIPKISLTSNLNAASPLTAPIEGMLIYNTGAAQTKGFYNWSGSAWTFMGTIIPNLSATTPLVIQSNSIKLNAGTQADQMITWDGVNWINTSRKAATSLDNRQPFLALNFCISYFGIFPSQSDASPYVGDIEIFAFNSAPQGWALCDGSLISIANYDTLFALIGTTYGGNGITTFALPDLRGRTAIHKGQGPGLPLYNLGQSGGSEAIIINDKY
jgi:microcystin-dependent protein